MTMQTLAGKVVDVALVERTEMGRTPWSGTVDVPVMVQATLTLTDGRTAYLETQVGYVAYQHRPSPNEHFHRSATEEQASHPWVISTGVQVAMSPAGSLFNGRGAYLYARPLLTVWAGDVVTVWGLVETRHSRAGSDYLRVRRAQVIQWNRPEWANATDGTTA